MGTFSLTHWLVVVAVVVLLFGVGRLPRLMGDLAKGIKDFKSGLREDEPAAAAAQSALAAEPVPDDRRPAA